MFFLLMRSALRGRHHAMFFCTAMLLLPVRQGGAALRLSHVAGIVLHELRVDKVLPRLLLMDEVLFHEVYMRLAGLANRVIPFMANTGRCLQIHMERGLFLRGHTFDVDYTACLLT